MQGGGDKRGFFQLILVTPIMTFSLKGIPSDRTNEWIHLGVTLDLETGKKNWERTVIFQLIFQLIKIEGL